MILNFPDRRQSAPPTRKVSLADISRPCRHNTSLSKAVRTNGPDGGASLSGLCLAARADILDSVRGVCSAIAGGRGILTGFVDSVNAARGESRQDGGDITRRIRCSRMALGLWRRMAIHKMPSDYQNRGERSMKSNTPMRASRQSRGQQYRLPRQALRAV